MACANPLIGSKRGIDGLMKLTDGFVMDEAAVCCVRRRMSSIQPRQTKRHAQHNNNTRAHLRTINYTQYMEMPCSRPPPACILVVACPRNKPLPIFHAPRAITKPTQIPIPNTTIHPLRPSPPSPPMTARNADMEPCHTKHYQPAGRLFRH